MPKRHRSRSGDDGANKRRYRGRSQRGRPRDGRGEFSENNARKARDASGETYLRQGPDYPPSQEYGPRHALGDYSRYGQAPYQPQPPPPTYARRQSPGDHSGYGQGPDYPPPHRYAPRQGPGYPPRYGQDPYHPQDHRYAPYYDPQPRLPPPPSRPCSPGDYGNWSLPPSRYQYDPPPGYSQPFTPPRRPYRYRDTLSPGHPQAAMPPRHPNSSQYDQEQARVQLRAFGAVGDGGGDHAQGRSGGWNRSHGQDFDSWNPGQAPGYHHGEYGEVPCHLPSMPPSPSRRSGPRYPQSRYEALIPPQGGWPSSRPLSGYQNTGGPHPDQDYPYLPRPQYSDYEHIRSSPPPSRPAQRPAQRVAPSRGRTGIDQAINQNERSRDRHPTTQAQVSRGKRKRGDSVIEVRPSRPNRQDSRQQSSLHKSESPKRYSGDRTLFHGADDFVEYIRRIHGEHFEARINFRWWRYEEDVVPSQRLQDPEDDSECSRFIREVGGTSQPSITKAPGEVPRR